VAFTVRSNAILSTCAKSKSDPVCSSLTNSKSIHWNLLPIDRSVISCISIRFCRPLLHMQTAVTHQSKDQIAYPFANILYPYICDYRAYQFQPVYIACAHVVHVFEHISDKITPRSCPLISLKIQKHGVVYKPAGGHHSIMQSVTE
jgi:hypothetical protein